jgi:long-chain acyl-CoA synthetase
VDALRLRDLDAGAVTVPIYETSSAEQVQWNLSDSGAVAVVLETAAHAALLDGVRGELPELAHVFQLDAGRASTSSPPPAATSPSRSSPSAAPG